MSEAENRQREIQGFTEREKTGPVSTETGPVPESQAATEQKFLLVKEVRAVRAGNNM